MPEDRTRALGFVVFALTGLAAFGAAVAVAEGRAAAGALGAEVPVSDEVPVPEELPVPEEVPVAEELATPEEVPVSDVVPVPGEVATSGEVPVPEEVAVPGEGLVPKAVPEGRGPEEVVGFGVPMAVGAEPGAGGLVKEVGALFAAAEASEGLEGEGESLATAAQAVVEAAATTAAPAAIAVQRRLPGESLPSLGDDLWEC